MRSFDHCNVVTTGLGLCDTKRDFANGKNSSRDACCDRIAMISISGRGRPGQ
jgi:hypothetical protein